MDSEPVFFLHFPRTAGTTIDAIFSANLPEEAIIKIYSREEYEAYRNIEPERLNGIKYITGHLLLGGTNPTTFYGRKVRAFTLLRDPVKRIWSEYHFLKTWDQQHLYSLLNENKISFCDYVRSEEKLLRYRGKNFMTRCIAGESLEERGDLKASLEKAKDNLLNSFWFYGMQERFIESMLLLAKKADLKNILHQKHNSLAPKITANGPSDEERQCVEEYNRADIELYRFALERFDAQIESLGDDFQKKVKEFTFLNNKYQKIASLLYKSAYRDSDSAARINLPKDARW